MRRLTVAAKFENLATVRTFLAEGGRRMGAEAEPLGHLILAVDELVTNVVEHGYRHGPGDVTIDLDRDRDSLVVKVADQAPVHDPLDAPEPDLTSPLEDRVPGGLGIHLVRTLTDEANHRALGQTGNEVTLRKRCFGQTTA
ncbi:MAG: ATP-binding protein [Fimbriimonadaceae bacterium]|nr:ATP-binding protein [Fimbriimonadaceae bacterium]